MHKQDNSSWKTRKAPGLSQILVRVFPTGSFSLWYPLLQWRPLQSFHQQRITANETLEALMKKMKRQWRWWYRNENFGRCPILHHCHFIHTL